MFSILLLFLYCSLIFFLSSQPAGLSDFSWPNIDKVIHFIEYSILGALSANAFQKGLKFHSVRSICIAAVLFSVSYALSDEWHQSFVPGRDPSWGDVLADTLGVIVGVMIWFQISQRNSRP